MNTLARRARQWLLIAATAVYSVTAGLLPQPAQAALAPEAEPGIWRFDLGVAPAPSGSTGGVAAPGYTGVTATTLYTPELGYGFSKALSSRNRGPAGSAVMQDDMVLGGIGDTYTFSADVPNGDYKVTLYTGDLLETTSTYKTKFAIEGVAKGTVNSRRAVETAAYTASVQDGQMTIDVTGDTTYSVLNGIVIETLLPEAPQGLAAVSVSSSAVKLQWSEVTGTVEYAVYRATVGGDTYGYLASVQTAEYTDTNVSVGAGYDYYVASFNAGGVRSPLAGPVTVAQIPAPQPPSMPVGLRIAELKAASVKLAWEVADGASGYAVYRSDAEAGSYAEIGQTEQPGYTDTTVDTSAVHYYKVQAINPHGVSPMSAVAASSVYVPPVALPEGETIRLDFGSGAVADGYFAVNDAVAYASELRYGFADPSRVSFGDRGTADAVKADYVLAQDTSLLIDLPNGDYTVSLVAGDAEGATDISIKAETIQKVQQTAKMAGEYLEMSFDIALVDGQLTLEFAGAAPKLNSLVIVRKAPRQPGELPTVYIAGDSTVQTYDEYWKPEAGWGQMLPRFFTTDVTFKNHAIGGRSSKSFIVEGRLDEVLRAIRPGDYFLVQFGHNDATISVPERYASVPDYKNYLQTYVNGARQRGATPILVTPMGRRDFNSETGKFNVSFPEYVQGMKEVAQQLNVPLVDLSTLSVTYYDSIGPDASLSVFLHTPPGVYGAFPNGSADNTHFQEYGAIQLAGLLAGGIQQLEVPLAAFVKEIAVPDEVPAAPAGVAAGSISNAGAVLSWQAVPTADIYKVYRKLAAAGDEAYALVGTSTIPTLSLGGMAEGETYHVRITAVNGKGESLPSETIAIRTKAALYRFDFGPVGSPVASGYTEVTRNTIYTPERGYGITDSTGMIDRDRGSATDALRRDFVAYFGQSYEFKVDVPNGYYAVKAYIGDWIGSVKTDVAIEGKGYGTTSSGKENIAEKVFNQIAVRDGQLNIVLSGQTAHLNGIEITPLMLAPTGLELVQLDLSGDPVSAELSWQPVAEAVRYRVYRQSSVAAKAELLGETTLPAYTDTTADVGLDYTYTVTALDATGFESVASNDLDVSMIDDSVVKAATPQGLILLAANKNDVSFSWNAVPGARMYNVYRSERAAGPYVLIGKSAEASYTDGTVLTTIAYYYKVASVNAGGISEQSETLDTPIVTKLVRDMEYLDRSPVAIRTEAGNYIGWRMLGLDPEEMAFNVYRGGVKLNAEPIVSSTNYIDAAGTADSVYTVKSVLGGVERQATGEFGVWQRQYLSVPLQKPADDYTKDGQPYTYKAGDASVGDLDGDGQYEIVMLWSPSNSKDNSQAGYTGIVYMDAYKLDGTRLWRINLGPNIRAGAHYTQFMVYDFDGDGRAEVAFKTADGTIDGAGRAIGDPSKDHRNSSGYVLLGNEYLTVFEGATGKALATVDYDPPRGDVGAWGDAYGNRVDRFLAAVAYLDGEHPSLIFSRGYYTRTVIAAYDFRNGQLTKRWTFDSNEAGSEYTSQGNHNLSIGDVDLDGKDEIHFGAMALDDDGTPLYTTGFGHGDAMHFSDLDPSRPGMELFDVHEHTDSPYGMEMRDALTGEVIWGVHTGIDTGRGLAADIDPRHIGAEMWSGNITNEQNVQVTGLHNARGEMISSAIPSSTNFAIWWDGDLLRELLDHNWVSSKGSGVGRIDKWDYENGTTVTLLTADGAYSNNSTKGNPSLQADLFGDWREEAMWRSEDSTELRIYSTIAPTEHRIRTLMHDPNYRLGIAWQNVAYNQPPHPSFYLGDGMTTPEAPSIRYVAGEAAAPTVVWNGAAAAASNQTFQTTYGLSGFGANPFYVQAHDLKIAYDASQVQFVSAQPMAEGVQVVLTNTDTPGQVQLLLISEGAGRAIGSATDVLKLMWRAVGTGTAELRVVSARLANSDGVVVQAVGAVTPTHQVALLAAVDKAALSQAISAAQAKVDAATEGYGAGQYVPGSKQRMLTALQAARAVLGDAAADTQQVAQAIAALREAARSFQAATGDLNGDQTVDIADLAMVAARYGDTAQSASWPTYRYLDINADGKIDIEDLVIVARKMILG